MILSYWWITKSQISFSIENKTDHSIKLIWDEAAYVGPTGESKRVCHSGVKYSEREAPQVPTVVARGTSLSDVIWPTDLAYFYTDPIWGRHRWKHAPLLPIGAAGQKPKDRLALAHEQIGRTIQLLLPLEIQGVINEYIFCFEITDAEWR